MSRAERKAKRSREKNFFEILERNAERLRDPGFVEKLKGLGLPCCPKCNTPILAGFGTADEEFDLCLNCGAEIPVNVDDGEQE